MNPTEDELDRWIEVSWHRHTRPQYSREHFRELWQEEQLGRAREREQDYRSKQLEELRRRVAAIERALGPGGKRLTGDLIAGIGEALGKIRVQDRERLLAEIERRGFVSYRGTWDESADYAKGAMVTCAGSTSIAVGPVEKGARPGRGPAWRLASKGADSKGPVVA